MIYGIIRAGRMTVNQVGSGAGLKAGAGKVDFFPDYILNSGFRLTVVVATNLDVSGRTGFDALAAAVTFTGVDSDIIFTRAV